jgi:hypothetical protein
MTIAKTPSLKASSLVLCIVRVCVKLKLTKIVLTKPVQLENAASAEADCLTDGETIRLCCSLYSLGDSEKLRLNAFVKEAWDS